MRASILTATAILLLIVTALLAITPGAADDATNQRLGDLETRVAALETRVTEMGASTPDNVSGQQGTTSSSSSTSSVSTDNAYTTSISGNGDREVEVEIDTAGTYQLTATAASAFTAVLEDGNGDALPDFSVETDAQATVTRSGALEPGTYILNVTATETWNVTIVLLAG
jgi:hypothetical protein